MGIDFTGSTLALVIVLFAVGLICIIKGGDLFVDAATWIAEASGIPKFIIGATVVSFATTMPEMLVSVFSAFEGNADIAVGNAVGSVTANTGLIMCLSLVCMSCYMTRKQFGVKAGLLLAAVVLLFTFTRDSALSISESIIIMLVFVGFMVESILAAKREQGSEAPDERPSTDGKSVAINIGKFILGAAAIVLGAQLLIDNGSALAVMIGVPDSVIAATMIAIGTSLPELVTAITSLVKGHGSLSIGNIIGANLFNLVLVSGVSVTLAPFEVPVGKTIFGINSSLILDMPLMLVVMALLTIPALTTKKLHRWQGILLLCIYAAFCAIQFGL